MGVPVTLSSRLTRAGLLVAKEMASRPDLGLAPDHMAVTPLQTPDAAADANIDVVQALLAQFAGASDIIMIV